MEKIKTVKCPVCGVRYVPHALSKHIVQMGQREIYYIYKKLGSVNLKSKGKPHQDYVIKNTYETTKFKIK
tara:strand:+ start:411 stop:620 length:210 start_codon:yes stop_codon:yes gene_type:complete